MIDLVQFTKQNGVDLTRILGKVEGKSFCEIGCWTGHSTSYIAREAKKRGGTVSVIDWFNGSEGTELATLAGMINVKETFIENMERMGLMEHIFIFENKSCYAAGYFKDNILDFLFIDGDHMYESVKSDLELYLPKMKGTGIIAGHDFESYTYYEKHTDVDWYGGKHNGVIKAVMDKFGDRVQRMGNIWYVELGKRAPFLNKAWQSMQEDFTHAGQVFDGDWMVK